MRAVFGLVLIVGLGLAGFAVYMVQGYFETQSRQLAQERAARQLIVPTVEVYAVNRTIEFGEAITMADVELIRYAEPYLPEGTFTDADLLFPRGDEMPRYVLRQMEPNEPILDIKVTDPGVTASITSLIAPGMRAFTIEVDATSGVSGFLRPGDRVDVYWTGQVSQGLSDRTDVTQLIETGLSLVAVDQTSDTARAGASIARTVTVQVTPLQVGMLTQAQATGNLSLSLVGHGDQGVTEDIEVTLSSMLGISAPEIAPVEAEVVQRVCTITESFGGEERIREIACRN